MLLTAHASNEAPEILQSSHHLADIYFPRWLGQAKSATPSSYGLNVAGRDQLLCHLGKMIARYVVMISQPVDRQQLVFGGKGHEHSQGIIGSKVQLH